MSTFDLYENLEGLKDLEKELFVRVVVDGELDQEQLGDGSFVFRQSSDEGLLSEDLDSLLPDQFVMASER